MRVRLRTENRFSKEPAGSGPCARALALASVDERRQVVSCFPVRLGYKRDQELQKVLRPPEISARVGPHPWPSTQGHGRPTTSQALKRKLNLRYGFYENYKVQKVYMYYILVYTVYLHSKKKKNIYRYIDIDRERESLKLTDAKRTGD